MKKCITLAALAIAAMTSAANGQEIELVGDSIMITAGDYGSDVYVSHHSFFGDRIKVELEYLDPQTGDWEDIDETYDADDVSEIVFYGGDGDDIFMIEDDDDFALDDVTFDCFLFGGDGQDVLMGGPGISFIAGEGGFDILHGGLGESQLDGGHDGRYDELHGGSGRTTFYRYYELRPRTWFPIPGLGPVIRLPFALPSWLAPAPAPQALVRVHEYERLFNYNPGQGDQIVTSEAN